MAEPHMIGPWLDDALPTVLAPGWHLLESRIDGRAWYSELLGLLVIIWSPPYQAALLELGA